MGIKTEDMYSAIAGIDWLFDPECEAYYAEDDPSADAVVMGDEPCVFATVDVILKWIKEGKPRDTNWLDGVGGCEHYDKE